MISSLLVITAPILAAEPLPEAERIFSHTEPSRQAGFDDIVFHLRMPGAWTPEGTATRGSRARTPAVRGVLAICNWSSDADSALGNIEPEGRFGHLVRWADERDLAVLTWTNFRGYAVRVSGDEMDRRQMEAYNRAFGERASRWERGFKRMAWRYGLPEEGMLLYGISGGAQMAHRLALRKPEYFAAVHVHVNSSYDVPTPEGRAALWLVTTGTRESGYRRAQRFYRNALENGYHMIFKAEENLGHADSPRIRRLSRAFFDFALEFVPDATDPEWKAPPEEMFYFMRYPAFVGDWYNQMSVPQAQAERLVPREFMVALPSRPVAEAWGPILELAVGRQRVEPGER